MAYVFDPEGLGECVSAGVGKPLEPALDAITEALVDRYPRWIQSTERKWIFSNAGGAMGQLTLLHTSLSEYLIFFGSPIGTEGHSGRYATELWDWMIAGEMWCYIEGETERAVYKAGDLARLGRGQTKGYKLPEGGWMLEYARGPIPQMLPFGLADTVLSTLDFNALFRTVAGYTKMSVQNLLRGKI